jgi:hypothetical protein
VTDTQPGIAADRLQALIARLPDASHVTCSVADLNEVLQELDEVTDFDRSALKTQELRDGRNRAVAMWHEQKKRADQAEAQRDQARGELADEVEWGIGCSEGDGAWYQDGFTRAGAHRHAIERGDGHFPAWRRLGTWHNATEEPTP